MRKQLLKVGDVFAIKLEDNLFGFAVVCEGGDFAFIDFHSNKAKVPDDFLSNKVAFRIFVAAGEPESSKWNKIGTLQLEREMLQPAKYLHKPIGSDRVYTFCNGESSPAEMSEVKDLEVLSSWAALHAEKRLKDFFMGEENEYVIAIKKQLKIK